MKKLLALFMVILIVLLASAPLVSCKGQPASTPSETAPTEAPPTGPPEPPTGPPEPPAGPPEPPTGPPSQTKAERIEPEPAKGFYSAYYLYVPSSISMADRENQKTYLLIVPNNTDSWSDDQEVHDKAAQELAEGLRVPLLVPAFPKPNEGRELYTHALDRDTILTEISELRRIDLQLIAMIDDAIERLSLEGINLEKKVLMMGFSASGMFANRFTLLHPERVQAATIGSPGGWPIAPTGEWNGAKLRYPIGAWDIEELVGEEFDIESLKSVPLYLYLGDKDTNDSVPKLDGYEQEDKQLIFQYFGDTPVERWPIAEEIYNSVGCSSQFVLYPGIEHCQTYEIFKDIETFFSNNLESL